MEKNGLMEILKMICWTILSMIGFVGRCLWVKDEKTAISGGDGVELWPRMAATAKFSLQDMKTVKRAIPNAGCGVLAVVNAANYGRSFVGHPYATFDAGLLISEAYMFMRADQICYLQDLRSKCCTNSVQCGYLIANVVGCAGNDIFEHG